MGTTRAVLPALLQLARGYSKRTRLPKASKGPPSDEDALLPMVRRRRCCCRCGSFAPTAGGNRRTACVKHMACDCVSRHYAPAEFNAGAC
jgi:hypothetical protein